jgi:molybdate transport system substrate-binding protein
VLGNVVSKEEDVKSVVAKLALGEADAGFCARHEAKPTAEDLQVIDLSEEAQPLVEYQITVVKDAEHQAAAAAL